MHRQMALVHVHRGVIFAVRFLFQRLREVQGQPFEYGQPLPPPRSPMLVFIAVKNQMKHRMHGGDLFDLHFRSWVQDLKTIKHRALLSLENATNPVGNFGVWIQSIPLGLVRNCKVPLTEAKTGAAVRWAMMTKSWICIGPKVCRVDQLKSNVHPFVYLYTKTVYSSGFKKNRLGGYIWRSQILLHKSKLR